MLPAHSSMSHTSGCCLLSFSQVAKQSLRPFCTICSRYFKTPRKFVEHVKSQGHKDKAKEVTPATSEDMDPERYRASARATQEVRLYPRLTPWWSRGTRTQGRVASWLPTADPSPSPTPLGS